MELIRRAEQDRPRAEWDGLSFIAEPAAFTQASRRAASPAEAHPMIRSEPARLGLRARRRHRRLNSLLRNILHALTQFSEPDFSEAQGVDPKRPFAQQKTVLEDLARTLVHRTRSTKQSIDDSQYMLMLSVGLADMILTRRVLRATPTGRQAERRSLGHCQMRACRLSIGSLVGGAVESGQSIRQTANARSRRTPSGPALGNAIFAATGQRIRTQPCAANGVQFA
jgi:hypothetical protein